MVQYLRLGNWYFSTETSDEEEAVLASRALWKCGDVEGVRILRTQTSVFKEALRKAL